MNKKKINILLVEDDEGHIDLITRSFESKAKQMDMVSVCNLREARARLSESIPDLIIVDYILPDGKGTELIPVGKEIYSYPVMVMTSHGDEQIAVDVLKKGALDYIVKSGFTLEDMPHICERSLREWNHIIERKQIEQKLKFTQFAVDHNSDAIYLVKSDGRICYVNHAACQSLEYTYDELVSMAFPDIGHNLPLHSWPAHWKEMKEVGTMIFEAHHRTKTGHVFPVEIQSNYLKYEGDEYVTSYVRDITARKESENALRMKNSFLQILQVAAVASNGAVKIEDAFKPVLNEICRYTGWPIGHAYVLSKDDPDLLEPSTIWHLENTEKFDTFRETTRKTKFAKGRGLPGRVLASGKPLWVVDVTRVSWFVRADVSKDIGIKSGFAFPVLVGIEVAAVLEFFGTEAIQPDNTFLEVLVDVGMQLGRVVERKRAEKSLRENEEKFRQLAENIPEVFRVTNVDFNRIIYVSPAYETIWGRTCKSLYEQPSSWMDSIHPDDRGRMNNALEKYILGKGNFDEEYRIVRPDGSIRWILDRAFSVKSKSMEPDKIVGIAEDITEQKQKNRLLLMKMRQAQMGEMLSMIAHQWKQPLTAVNAIVSNTINNLVLDKSNNEDVMESLEKIQHYIYFLSQTINDFKSFFKPDKAKEPVNIDNIIQRSLSIIGKSLEVDRIKINTSFESGREIITYPNELIQVFLNIFKNAEDRINERKIENAIVAVREYENDGFIIIDITDNAGGVSEDVIDDIFLPYFSTKDEKQGTGLGLYICKTIIEEHCKGEIKVQNTDGGAKFTIKLPINS